MNYFFDTNAIIIYLKDKNRRNEVRTTYHTLVRPNVSLISVVTLGEIESIALRNNWGARRIQDTLDFLNRFVVVDINVAEIIKTYGRVDAYSQGKLDSPQLPVSSRNMGKNDLWIAASAIVSKSKLITADKDFLHLDQVFLDLIYIDLNKEY